MALAAPLAKATAAFDNARPERAETAWGRLVADALREAAKADIALINAGSLNNGTLPAGEVETAQVEALLKFPDDEVVVVNLTGAQLRAALERAVHAYPRPSSAMLHASGFTAAFNAQAPINRRITLVRFNGREVDDKDTFKCAMPVGLAEGTGGYFTIWNEQGATRTGRAVRAAVVNLVRERKEIAPDPAARFAAQ
jgi:2',3'-cyclic-nucleotide 2'-phosphodiesterase (5'-nucleotidase family)